MVNGEQWFGNVANFRGRCYSPDNNRTQHFQDGVGFDFSIATFLKVWRVPCSNSSCKSFEYFPRFLFKMPIDNCTVTFLWIVQEIQCNRHSELTPHC